MIESNVISKQHIIHNYNCLINKRYNFNLKICIEKIAGYKKKDYIYFIDVKNLNNFITNNFNIIRR